MTYYIVIQGHSKTKDEDGLSCTQPRFGHGKAVRALDAMFAHFGPKAVRMNIYEQFRRNNLVPKTSETKMQ